MYNALACQPASNIGAKDYGEIFGFICGADKKACSGISTHPDTGVYGAYSMCSDKHKLGHVLDAYYKNQGNAKDACNFAGKAVINSNVVVAETCKAALSSASVANSIAATATSAAPSGSSTKNPAPGPARSFLAVGDLAMGMYVMGAMAVGGAMVML